MHYVLAPEWPPASLTSFPQDGDGDSESEASLDDETKEQLRSQYLMSQTEAREKEAMMHELVESAFLENSQARRTQVMMSVATPQQKKRKSPMKDGKRTA